MTKLILLLVIIVNEALSNSHSGQRINQHLDWKSHVYETSIKLRRVNGALSKLRHYISLKTLVNIYHQLFSSWFLFYEF